MTAYLIIKTNGDDSSDISGCLLSISAKGLKSIDTHAKVQDELASAHECFSAVSFNIGYLFGELAGVEVFWLTTESEWQDDFNVGANVSHVFIKQEDFERLKDEGEPDWRIGIERIVFDKYGDCFIEGSYENAHGCEESAILPISEIAEQLAGASEVAAVGA